MNVVRKIFITLLCIAAAWIVLRKTYRYYLKRTATVKIQGAKELEGGLERVHTTSNITPPQHNFSRTVMLIEQTQTLKKDFKQSFSGVPSKVKSINIKTTKTLLTDLYREKIRLQRYRWESKVYHHGNVPQKISRTISYYQGVIEKCITDVEAILRQA